MCGISGFIAFNTSLEIEYIEKMNNQIRHRGVDDEGYYILSLENQEYILGGNDTKYVKSDLAYAPKENINTYKALKARLAFGHRRLSIVDLSESGHQPLSIDNGTYWITYNGEVYNYIEIKQELEALGHKFVSNCDTEVILVAYKQWGASCLNKFNGMFAFVIYNKTTHKIFIARDRFGIKPLYYYKDENIFAFASEIKSLLKLPMIKCTPNYDYLKNYLANGAQEHVTATAFANIFRFDFASFWNGSSKELNESFVPQKFWQIKPNLSSEAANPVKLAIYAKQYAALLENAVKLRLRADVKIGSALSGGLDSSSIVCLMNQELKQLGKTELQETFSTVYLSENVRDCDESLYINQLAAFLTVKSNQIEPKAEDVITEHRKIILAMENPPESTCISGWHTFKLVKQLAIKVTLDGQGADEQLAGYMPYLTYYFAQLPLVRILSQYTAFKLIPSAKLYCRKGILLNILARLLTKKGINYVLHLLGYKTNYFIPLNEVLYNHTNAQLVTLLHYADSTSMAFSVESRMPFMDYRMVEFLASVPAGYKIYNGWTKALARYAMNKKLPDDVCWRKDKMGWPIPEKYWFNGYLKEIVKNKIDDSTLIKYLLPKLEIKQEYEGLNLKQLIRIFNLAVFDEVFLTGQINA